MKLLIYLTERGKSQSVAAVEIGISRQYLNNILKQKAIPGRAVAQKIVKWSNGMVKLEDLWDKISMG